MSSYQRHIDRIVIGVAFIIFFLVISYKLTNASLWYDETVEFWYSKHMFGSFPWPNASPNMYRRIVSTYQPPLFNILFYFWLKISESEWWMRMFGIVMGMVGAAGVYKTIFFGTKSSYKAAFAVVLYATIYHLTYFWQEVAEYSLMLGLISWTVYFCLRVVDQPNSKSIVLFVIFCILPMYSQYGAAFPVVALALMALIKLVLDRDKKSLKVLLTSYGAAVVFAAIPLYLFFIKLQMRNQGTDQIRVIQDFSLSNFWEAYVSVFKWSFMGRNVGETEGHILIAVIVTITAIAIFYVFKGKKLWLKYLLGTNVACFILFFSAVTLGFYTYAYGHVFAARYNVFFIPLWFVTIYLLLDAFFTELSELKTFQYAPLRQLVAVVGVIVVAGLLCWGYQGWSDISNNWKKEDIRGATKAWYKKSGYKINTIVYFAANSGFSYYAMHDNRYNKATFKKVIFQKAPKDRTVDGYKVWVDSTYKKWPDSLYIVASHMSPKGNFPALVKVFTDAGYKSTNIFNKNGARLVRLELESKE